jgi:pimeloyl-ACP methyl ester carboxylesterase
MTHAIPRRRVLGAAGALSGAVLMHTRAPNVALAAPAGVREGPLYRSAAGRAAVMALYQRKLAALPFAHDSRYVATRFGQTHVLSIGPVAAPPLVALHGVHFSGPWMAEIVRPFADTFRVHIPDVVGQPGLSAEAQPEPAGHNYARWLTDVLDALGLDAVPMAGVSFGGAIVIDLAALAPARITKAALVVPAGFATDASVALPLIFRLLLPWTVYRLVPDRARVPDTVRALAAEMNEDHYDYFDAILRHVHWLIPTPGPFTRDDLAGFTAPVAVYAARDDIFFPGEALLREARAVLPNLADAMVVDGSHFPTRAAQAEIDKRMAGFLARS